MSTPKADRSVNEIEAAEILGIAPATLRKMRSLGPQSTGLPAIPYFKYSARCVRYSVAELEAWREAFRVQDLEDKPTKPRSR